jgi:hypothetical protein
MYLLSFYKSLGLLGSENLCCSINMKPYVGRNKVEGDKFNIKKSDSKINEFKMTG